VETGGIENYIFIRMAKKFTPPKHEQKSDIKKYKEETEKNLKSDHDKYLSFSFKYLKGTEKFPTHHEDPAYLPTLMDRLVNISRMKSMELIQNNSQALRCHTIDWEKNNVTEKNFGIQNEEQIVSKPFQFQITANAYGRVHGFFINEVFYIRWLDPHHNLYEREK